MEETSPSNFNQHPTPRRRVRLIPATPLPMFPPPSSSSSSTMRLLPSSPSSDNLQAGSPRGVVPGADPEVRLPYPLCFLVGVTRNEAFQPRAPVHTQSPSTGRRVPLIPTAPQRNPSLEAGTSRPPKKRGGHLYAEIIREAMAKIPPYNEGEGESLSPLSSSSLRFSTEDDGNESDGTTNGRKKGKTFEEIADEVIRDMQKAGEEEEGRRAEGIAEMGEPSQPVPKVNNVNPYENLMQEMIDLTGTDDEVDAEEDEWRKNMEERVDALTTEVAEQHTQTTRLVDLMKRVVSWMDRETQASSNPSPATSAAPHAGPQQPNTDIAGPSKKRKTRRPDSPGSQGKN